MKPLEVLKKYWGYDSFRPLQEDIINDVIEGKDSLALLPTGGGKSICFQIPALCMDGICIVISPLIALMKDQVYNLRKLGISATAIYSGMHYKEIDRTFDNCVYGGIKILYLSPERLSSDLAIARIKKMNVNLIAVDEAHCISQWGYDFRPSYLEIANIREILPKTPVLALTATATVDVVKDIQEKLLFKKENVFQQSFARSNLAYVVLEEEGKLKKLFEILSKIKGTGIVYVRSRNRTKDIALWLQKNQIQADYYHAGLDMETRSRKQEDWINNKIRIMVSTNAFGMGIDKADVRIVVHMDLPDNLEAYYQEAGRGGRDGKKSFAVLLYNQDDRSKLERMFEMSFPQTSVIKRTYQALGSYFQLATGAGIGDSFDFEIHDFVTNYHFKLFPTFSALKVLEQAGWIALTESVYVPTSLRVNVSKDELYDYLLQNKKSELIIKTILRTYQGAFRNFVNINEKQLANFFKMSRADLVNQFLKLQSEGIIDYKAKKDKPQIIFLKERVSVDVLTIDQAMYQFRKNRQLERIKKAIEYAEYDICRSRQLLAYFGETAEEDCGVCDVCLGRNKKELSTDDFESYKSKIENLLKEAPLSIEDLINSFAPKRKNQVLKAIEYLTDEGIVDVENELLTWTG